MPCARVTKQPTTFMLSSHTQGTPQLHTVRLSLCLPARLLLFRYVPFYLALSLFSAADFTGVNLGLICQIRSSCKYHSDSHTEVMAIESTFYLATYPVCSKNETLNLNTLRNLQKVTLDDVL